MSESADLWIHIQAYYDYEEYYVMIMKMKIDMKGNMKIRTKIFMKIIMKAR